MEPAVDLSVYCTMSACVFVSEVISVAIEAKEARAAGAQSQSGETYSPSLSQVEAPTTEGRSWANTIPSGRLDFLRGVAAVYVVFNHARGHLFAGGSVISSAHSLGWLDYLQLALLQATSLGTEAVILFFVLSGFAMAHSIRYTRSISTFYLKRTIRIWPAYLLAVALAFGFALLILQLSDANSVRRGVETTGWGFADLVKMALYVDVNSVLTDQFWSLPHEVIFYILCPLLLVSLNRVRIFWAISITMTVGGALNLELYNDLTMGGDLIYQHFYTLLVFFMTGAMAYYYQHLIPRVSPFWLAIVVIAYVIVLLALNFNVSYGWDLVRSSLTVSLSVILIRNVPAKIYKLRSLNWGHFSYSIYLFHFQLIMFIAYLLAEYADIEQREIMSYWAWTLAVPPVLLICWLLYFVSEKPCSDLLAKWRNRERQCPAPVIQS